MQDKTPTKCSRCKIYEVLIADNTDRIGAVAIQNIGLNPTGSKHILLKRCPQCGRLTFYLNPKTEVNDVTTRL